MEINGVLQQTLAAVVGAERAEWLFQVLEVPQALLDETGTSISRAGIAQALNMMLFDDLLARVPDARLYTGDCLRDGKKIMHDHGAVRTVNMAGMGALPAGEEAITRILRPLGYALNGVYPLERLKMTGRSHAQVEFPEELAQFFISELHPERFSDEFQAAVARVMSTCTDPLTPEAYKLLAEARQAPRAYRRGGHRVAAFARSCVHAASRGCRASPITSCCSLSRPRWRGSLPRATPSITRRTASRMWTRLPLNRSALAAR